MKILLVLLLLLWSCQPEDPLIAIDPRLQPYYQKFLEEAEIRSVRLPRKNTVIYYEEMKGKDGNCRWNKFNCTIQMHDKFINITHYSLYVERVVFHELGHGLLDRHHTSETVDSVYTTINYQGEVWKSVFPFPLSLMYAGNETAVHYFYSANREYYLDELFNFSRK